MAIWASNLSPGRVSHDEELSMLLHDLLDVLHESVLPSWSGTGVSFDGAHGWTVDAPLQWVGDQHGVMEAVRPPTPAHEWTLPLGPRWVRTKGVWLGADADGAQEKQQPLQSD